jgi:hypothetical protein
MIKLVTNIDLYLIKEIRAETPIAWVPRELQFIDSYVRLITTIENVFIINYKPCLIYLYIKRL